MDVFPDYPKPRDKASFTPVWNTTVSGPFKNGGEQRRSNMMFALYDVKQTYQALGVPEVQILWDFYMARKGALGAFWFFDFYVFEHKNLYVCTGDGSTTVFDLPGKSTSSRTLYANGTEITSGFSYLSGGGDGGADRVSFTVAPAEGMIHSIDFAGFLRAKVRFLHDRLSREDFFNELFNTGIELKGVK